MFPTSSEYLIVGGLFGVYLVLRLDLFPKLSNSVDSRSFLLLFFCGVAFLNVHIHHKSVQQETRVDYVSDTEKSLQELGSVLPKGIRVGFGTDIIKKSNAREYMHRYYQARYSLAPRVVEEGASPDWVIVSMMNFNASLIPPDLVLVRNFGNGIMLFRKRVE
jgi:hypothetical protein